MDLKYTVPETNQLWIKWKSINKIGNGRVDLQDAEFYGPVTQDYLPLEDTGTLRLDLTHHFLFRIDEYYIVEISWESVKTQEQGSIKFDKITINDENVGLLDKIKEKDLLLIDCSGHTEEERAAGNYKMVYEAMLYNETGAPYDFSKK